MIAVIGVPRLRGTGPDAVAAGLAAGIAGAAAAAGSLVELIGKTGDDPAGDAILLELARRGVGHVATLRDPARPTPVVPAEDDAADIEPSEASPTASPAASRSTGREAPVLEAADVGLALRYLPEMTVVVTVHAAPEVVDEAVAAANWEQTDLIVVVAAESEPPAGLPEGATVVAADDADDPASGAAAAIGRYAAALDQGEPASDAHAALAASETG